MTVMSDLSCQDKQPKRQRPALLTLCPEPSHFTLLLYFLAVLGFELGALYFLGRCCTIEPCPQSFTSQLDALIRRLCEAPGPVSDWGSSHVNSILVSVVKSLCLRACFFYGDFFGFWFIQMEIFDANRIRGVGVNIYLRNQSLELWAVPFSWLLL
jgi:hypothetical protein